MARETSESMKAETTVTVGLGERSYEIAISAGITIQGPGPALLTVSGNNVSRVFDLGSSDQDVVIAGLTIADMQALYCGNLYEANAMVGQRMLRQIGMTGIPVTNVANACATGTP